VYFHVFVRFIYVSVHFLYKIIIKIFSYLLCYFQPLPQFPEIVIVVIVREGNFGY